MVLINRFIGKSIKAFGDFLGQNSSVVAAIELREAADTQKAVDAIKRSVKRSNKDYLLVIIEL